MLSDTSTMPCTEFAGLQMQDVPAPYLLWLLKQDWAPGKYPEIVEYAKANKDRLEKLRKIR